MTDARRGPGGRDSRKAPLPLSLSFPTPKEKKSIAVTSFSSGQRRNRDGRMRKGLLSSLSRRLPFGLPFSGWIASVRPSRWSWGVI